MNKDLILKLREETGAGVMNAKAALDEFNGDFEKAREKLLKMGLEKADKKKDREIKAGLVYSYIHGGDGIGGRVGVLVKVGCETDFVAKTEDFKALCKELAMQISAMNPKDVEELLSMVYIRDGSKSVEDLIKGLIAKVGENVVIDSFARLEI